MINFNIEKWRDFLENVAQRPEEIIHKMEEYCQNIKKLSQQDKCSKPQKNNKIAIQQPPQNISPFLQILNLEKPEYRCSSRGVYKKPKPSVENLHVCCSAYAKISQTYIDMLGDGKKVRFLHDSNLGPILRMITCVRIKTAEDLKKAFRAFATQRIKRICYFPKEIMNLCVIVITVTENPFCKIAGRLRTIGQPAIRITFSKNELEAERRSISMLMDCDEPERFGSFLSLLKVLTGLLREGIIVSHFDLLLKNIFHDTRSLYKTLMKNNVQVEAEPRKSVKKKDYRDGLIEQCKLEIADLKKKLGQKGVQNFVEELKELSQKSSSTNVPNCESAETLTVNQETETLLLQSEGGEQREKLSDELSTPTINLSGKQSEIEVLERELERINSDIKIVKKLNSNEKKIMSFNFIEILKYYFNDVDKVKELYFNYGHAKMVEDIGVPDYQKCRSLMTECFRWNKKKHEWVMKPKVEKTCRKILKTVNWAVSEMPLTVMDAFKMYINWQYEFQARKSKTKDMSQVNSISSNCSFHSLCKLLETTYKPQFTWYIKKSKSEVNLMKSTHKLEKLLNDEVETVVNEQKMKKDNRNKENKEERSLKRNKIERFKNVKLENSHELIDESVDKNCDKEKENVSNVRNEANGTEFGEGKINKQMGKILKTIAKTSRQSHLVTNKQKSNEKTGKAETLESKKIINKNCIKRQTQMEMKKKKHFKNVEDCYNETAGIQEQYVYYGEERNRELDSKQQVLEKEYDKNGQKCLIMEPNFEKELVLEMKNGEQPVREYGVKIIKRIQKIQEKAQPAVSHLIDFDANLGINLSLEHNCKIINGKDDLDIIECDHVKRGCYNFHIGCNGESFQRSSESDIFYEAIKYYKGKSEYGNIDNFNLTK